MSDSMTESTVSLRDHTSPTYLVREVELDVDLRSEVDARIRARLTAPRNPAVATGLSK